MPKLLEMSQPLTQQDFASLLSCLQNALNQNPEVQKQAEAYIQSLDSRAGFSSALAVCKCASAARGEGAGVSEGPG